MIDGSSGKTPRHGFLVVSRTTRWRLAHVEGKRTEWLPKREADELLAKWDDEAAGGLKEATGRVEKARERFLAETELEIVSVPNQNPFQADDRKPTVTFPDGSTMQFEEGAPEKQIRQATEEAAREVHPDPTLSELGESRPELESRSVWELEFLANQSRRSLSDISSWDHFFPMAGVIEALDELSREGWSVLSASEDRGLDPENASVPLRVRYLLVRDIKADSMPRQEFTDVQL